MNKFNINELWRKLQVNRKLLLSCDITHDFNNKKPGVLVLKYYTCTKCGGEADPIAVEWYRIGVKHGRI